MKQLFPDAVNAITEFHGDYGFLSNFYSVDILFEGSVYKSVEHAYQAAKTLDPAERKKIRPLSAGAAKRAGKRLSLRKDWESVKLDVMYNLIKQKFSNTDLAILLKQTEPLKLVEGNTWGDTYWGVCGGVGQNHLGKILMRVRDDIGT